MIGRVISGRYVVEAVVGTGGMAVVYRAYDKIKKMTVAVKVLRPEYESDEEFVRRFSREAEAASKVSHENIVNMFDVGMDGDCRYIVMEYVDGQTLKEMIREQGRIAPDQALRMTIRILAAVDHAHRNGIVHRDIKPQNILVDKHGRVKVADFGIARLKTAQTTLIDPEGGASALGSVHYFSPEQARGEVADEKSDLYSVGVVLYEMLTGQVPFDGETAVSVALKHVSETPTSMLQLQGGISRALDEVTMRALCKDTERRYQTAAEMAADLRRTITHPRGGFVKYPQDPEEAERQRELRRRRQQRNRRRLVRTVVGITVTLAVCACIVLGWYFINIYDRAVVPNVVGHEREEAWEMLEQLGFPVGFETAYNEEYPEGTVFEQSRTAGERLKKGTAVTIVVSAGTQWYYLENLEGMTEIEALTRLSDSGAQSYTVEYTHSDMEVGRVVGQSEEAGWQNKETTIVLTVSGESVRMPKLTGLTLDGACALLEAEGLVPGGVVEAWSADMPPQTVIEQSVEAETMVLTGTHVNLTVSQRTELVCYPESLFTVVVPLEDLQVEITLIPSSGTEVTAYSAVHDMGTHQVELASAEKGMHTVRVYIDGVLMDTAEIMFD